MKMSLLIGVLVLALSGGYVAAENTGKKNTSGSPANRLEAPVTEHAKFCTKNMRTESDNGVTKAPMDSKEHDSTDSKEPHKHM